MTNSVSEQAQRSLAFVVETEGAEVFTITSSGDVIWRGQLVENPEDLRAALLDMCQQVARMDTAHRASEAALEQAFREGRTDGVNAVDRYGETQDTDDEAVAAWRERRAAEKETR